MLIFLVPMPLYNLPRMRLQLSNMSLECIISYGKLEKYKDFTKRQSPHPFLLLHRQWYEHPHERQNGKAVNRNQCH